MPKVRIELNSAGVREILKSEEMMGICREHADSARSKLGEGYEVTTHTGRNRVNAEIAAVTYEAKLDNSRNNTILKALR